MHNLFYLSILFILTACGGLENQKIDIEKAKNSPLLIPPKSQK